jgi:hypothetical protein
MRKYLYAGAIAGGLLLLGAAPAYADTNVPDPAGGQSTGGLLGPDGHLKLDNPLGHAKVLDVKPGRNTPDVAGAAGSVLPQSAGGQLPAARTGLGQAGDAAPLSAAQPATGAVRSVLPGTADTEGLPGGLGGGLSGLPVVGGLLGGGLPVVGGGGLPVGGGGLPVVGGGGLPVGGGGLPVGGGGLPIGGGGAQESGLAPADLPLLGGGLGGLLPFAMPQSSAFDGLPAGGTPVSDQSAVSDHPAQTLPAAQTAPAAQTLPAGQTAPAAKPAKKPKASPDAATASDARVHEEPVDTEGGGRQFSSGRPVAGTDPDFK